MNVEELEKLIEKLSPIDSIESIKKLNTNEAKKYKLLCEYIFELLKEHKFKIIEEVYNCNGTFDELISFDKSSGFIEKVFVCHCRLRDNFKEPNHDFSNNMYKHSIEFLLSSELLTDESLSQTDEMYLKLFEYLYSNKHNLCSRYQEEYNGNHLIEHCISQKYTILFKTIIKYLHFESFSYKDDNEIKINVIGYLIYNQKYDFIRMIPDEFYENKLNNLSNCYNYLNTNIGLDARFSCQMDETELNEHQQMSKYFFGMMIKHPDFKKYYAKEISSDNTTSDNTTSEDELKKQLEELEKKNKELQEDNIKKMKLLETSAISFGKMERKLAQTESDLRHVYSLFGGGGSGSYNRVCIKQKEKLEEYECELKLKIIELDEKNKEIETLKKQKTVDEVLAELQILLNKENEEKSSE